MKKVIMVVPVLITSCQVLEKPNNGPVANHNRTAAIAIAKAQLVPEYFVALPDRRSSDLLIRFRIGAQRAADLTARVGPIPTSVTLGRDGA